MEEAWALDNFQDHWKQPKGPAGQGWKSKVRWDLRREHDLTALEDDGLRMGVAEMTRFGMKEEDFSEFAPLFAEAVNGRNVGDEVARFRERFQNLYYCFDEEFPEAHAGLAKLF